MGIRIRLDGEYVITGDVRQYVLNKVRVRDWDEESGKPVETLTPVGYFQKIDALIHELIKRKLSDADISSLKELLGEVSELARKYAAVIEVIK